MLPPEIRQLGVQYIENWIKKAAITPPKNLKSTVLLERAANVKPENKPKILTPLK